MMKMIKVRIWTGKQTLASNGQIIKDDFHSFEKWLKKQPGGLIEVWAGRWWTLSKEAVPFIWNNGCHCAHGSYQSRRGLDTKEFSGFFTYEAWKKATSISSFWTDIDRMSENMIKDASNSDG